MKRITRFTFGTLATVLAVLAPMAAHAMGSADQMTESQRHALAALPQDVRVELDGRGVPSWLMGRLAARTFADPAAAAHEALDLHGPSFRRGSDDGFAVRTQETDQQGETHVRMTQLFRGLPVVGGELIVHLTRDQVVGINGRFVADLDLDTNIGLSASQLASSAEAFTVRNGGTGVSIVEVGEAVVYAAEGEPRVAVRVQITYHDVAGVQVDDVYVDARNGAGLGKSPRVFRAKSRKIYNANQACINTGSELPGTLMFNEGGSSSDSAAMGAYNGTGTTYDFYKATFNRDSYDAAGAVMVSSVHAQFNTGTSCDKNNAAWFDAPQNQMAYGDGDGTTFSNLANGLDVTAHELTHAVTSRSANLTYSKESGALNEGTSDILGESTAFYAGAGDWKIGAEVYTPGTSGDALRYMYNPTADGYSADYYPERLYSGTCTPSGSNDECGVHGNSGIANLAYYLMSQGGTHPRGKTTVSVTGIGIAKAEQIWYKALTAYMTSSTNFAGARTATANAATALYGSCGAEYIAAQKAWDAVGVGGTWSCGGGTFSISGSAGTSGATVSSGAASATSDASNNYTIAGLAAGTYTVTPSKSGCTFSPASSSVTITSANVTGVSFTASCGGGGDIALTSGVAKAGSVSGATANAGWTYYTIIVPSGATNLAISVNGLSADADLYDRAPASAGAVATHPTTASYTGRSWNGSTTAESLAHASPIAGTWSIGVTNYATGTINYTVTATVTTATATYTISGNAGTTGASVTAGSASATSDASSNFTLSSLAAGTYTVTPSKSGCTFTPANRSVTVGPSATGVNFTASCGGGTTQLLANPGFESGAVSWTQTSGVIDSSTSEASHSGSWKAWMDGYGSAHTDSIYQQVTIPSTATTATLSFWLHIDTAETTTVTQYDKLNVQIRNSSGTVLATLATYSNLNAAAGYSQKSFNVLAYKGQTVQVYLVGTEDTSAQTSFVVDDFALNVQ